MTGKRVSESLIDTFVNQNAHLGTCEQEVFCFFESSDGGFARDSRKPLEKVFECFSALEIVEESLDGNPRSAKHWSSAKNFGIFNDDSHEAIVSRGGWGRHSSLTPNGVPAGWLINSYSARRSGPLTNCSDPRGQTGSQAKRVLASRKGKWAKI